MLIILDGVSGNELAVGTGQRLGDMLAWGVRLIAVPGQSC